ncbi:hypothetical protein B0T14DRAFT_434788 [Immersiella caudata]|uniref:Glutaminase GtaA n=1 Tax=Immersiella caudata TaxID=314043 RepID=A0AA39WJ18_9PEZI|nr:hypothetical protein B0T14DRAFT_434788 [Immersiella caudata]
MDALVKPPAVPLAVRSPYLNAWLEGGDTQCILPGQWPKFWTSQTQGWQGLVQVDGKTYTWMGAAPGFDHAKQVSLHYTSTKSEFVFDVDGKVHLTVTFLSPVYPDDLSRQSQQFSYVSVKVACSDTQKRNVQVYMDVSGEWASGNASHVVKWEQGVAGGNDGNVTYLKFSRENQEEFAEQHEVASWGNWYLSTNSGDGMTWQIGEDNVVRSHFKENKALANNQDTQFRAVGDRWPVFALSHDITVEKGGVPEKVFTLGLVQDQVINFAGHSQALRPIPGLWSSYWADEREAVAAFYNDYQYAREYSQALDTRIQDDSVRAAGQDYAAITTLALRQAFGGLQFAGTPDKPYIFLKEISSNSDIQTVDVIFPAYPIFHYLNATLSRYLLDPLFENQESGAYPNKWAEHDLGTFPVAKGYPEGLDEPMPLEECGNMIIMTLAYAQRTGDIGYLKDHYPKLEQWAEFLVEDSLVPANQLSTDDFAGTLANQTNLAIKGIIGLKAMGEIAKMTKGEDKWSKTAYDYLQTWKTYAINRDADLPHTTLSYGDNSSHGILYNLYADRLLNLNFVDQEIYDMQSAFYPTIALEYAVPLDTRHTWAKSDWEMFAAAVAGNSTRDMFIQKLAHWVGNSSTNRPMTDLFDARTGGFPDGPTFVARPVVGGMFALLALLH